MEQEGIAMEELKPCPFCGGDHAEFSTCVENEECLSYEPMPDVEALLKLATRMEADANEAIYFEMTMEPFDVAEYAAKIREAVGA